MASSDFTDDEEESFVVRKVKSSGRNKMVRGLDSSSDEESENQSNITASSIGDIVEDSFTASSTTYRTKPQNPLLSSDSEGSLTTKLTIYRTKPQIPAMSSDSEDDDEVIDESSDDNQASFTASKSSIAAAAVASSSEDLSLHSIEDSDVIVLTDDEVETVPVQEQVQSPVQSVLKKTTTTTLFDKPENKPQPPVKPETKLDGTAVVPQAAASSTSDHNKIPVSAAQFEMHQNTLKVAENQLSQAMNAKRIVKLESLPDKGAMLNQKVAMLQKRVDYQRAVMAKLVIRQPQNDVLGQATVNWEQLEQGVGAVAPRTFGKKGMDRFREERQMTVETLNELHRSLEKCPGETDVADDPKGLKVELMLHQKRALAWLLWRESQKPSGGVLADDMGLGKTLTMIALTMKSMEAQEESEEDKENHRHKYPGGTLVVCPASLIEQWSGEIERRVKRGMVSVELHHGTKRETSAKKLAQYDFVISTYTLALNDVQKNGPLSKIHWRRIILDEAHQIRNHKAQSSEAVCKLSGKTRWALTGTPVHNKELDMYALLKFLHCSPFDNLQVWKHWVGDKSSGGKERLHAVISSLMLRRTKAELMEKKILKSLPERTWELIPVTLDKEEMEVYQRILIFSRTLFAAFMHQRAEKRQDEFDLREVPNPTFQPNQEYYKMRDKLLKLNKVKDIKQHEILVLLLRLRQICCHPSLITAMLEGDDDLGDVEDPEEFNLLEQLNNLTINEEETEPTPAPDQAEAVGVNLREASKGYLNSNHPVFEETRRSSKIRTLIDILLKTLATGDKVVVVSQWTGLLRLVAIQLKKEEISFDELNGSIPIPKRMPIVDNFNNPKHKTQVLLLSLTAGGVGLNLVGGNHLFLLDLHWNPQLENQAQDRIYRVGQTKPISVYKFMATDTIEERIKNLQDSKLELANSMLTGSQQVLTSKLSLNDLKMLFDFK